MYYKYWFMFEIQLHPIWVNVINFRETTEFIPLIILCKQNVNTWTEWSPKVMTDETEDETPFRHSSIHPCNLTDQDECMNTQTQ